MSFNRVLITGAAGQLGSLLRQRLAERFLHVRVSDIADLGQPGPGEEVVWCDLTDAAAVEKLCRNVDAIIHLAARSREGRWETVIASNIVGTINLFEGARKAGTDRVLFASSNHAVGLYEREVRIDHRVPPMPDSRYGVSKAFGEELAKLYAYKHGVRAFCMRIGSCVPEPTDERMLSTWLSYGDFERLIEVGLNADYVYEIVYGVSKNSRSWWDNSNAHRLGYAPRDNAEQYVVRLKGKRYDNEIADRYQGGTFASTEYEGTSSWTPGATA